MILSDKWATILLDSLRGIPFTPPTKYFVGLMNTDTEVTGGSYQRLEYDATANAWNLTGRALSTVANLDWGTALESWGTVSKIRLYEDSTGTDYIGDIEVTPFEVNNGDTVEILVGDFTIRL